jgi:REP element-mobilizing transposase RayT
MSRGNGGQDIFLSDNDRNLFLSLIEELSERYNIQIHAYVLMGNHYHLLVKTVEPNLSMAMQWFGTTYTRKFNIANQIGGHLFQGRFKSIIVQNDAYLLRLSCYIHRNPLRAGIVERLADYSWSSYRYYAYKKEPPSWLTTDSIFSQVSGGDRHKAYRIKTQNYSDEQNKIWEDIKHGLIYGSQKFVDDIKKRFLGDSKDVALPQYNSLLRTFDPEQLLGKASEYLGFDINSAKKAKKIAPEDKINRDMMIHLIRQTGRLSNNAIGEYFGLTYSSISKCVKAVSDRLSSDTDFEERYLDLKSQFKL